MFWIRNMCFALLDFSFELGVEFATFLERKYLMIKEKVVIDTNFTVIFWWSGYGVEIVFD